MSIDALARRFESSVANSLYSDDSRRRRRAALHRLGDDAQPEHPRDLGLGRELGDALAHDRVVAERLAVARLGAHVVAQQVEPLLDRREREHREALEVERLGDVLEAPVELADDVVVGDPHVVEEDVVGALVAHRPDRR